MWGGGCDFDWMRVMPQERVVAEPAVGVLGGFLETVDFFEM